MQPLLRSATFVIVLALVACHRAPTPTTPSTSTTVTDTQPTAAREAPLATREEPAPQPTITPTTPEPPRAPAGLRGLDLADEHTSLAAFADLDAVRRSELDARLQRAIREHVDGDPIKALLWRKLYEAHTLWCYATFTSDGGDAVWAIEGVDVATLTSLLEANDQVRFVAKHGEAREYAVRDFSFALRAPDSVLIGARRTADLRIAPMPGFGAWIDRFGGVAPGHPSEALRGTVHAVSGEQASAFVAVVVTPELLALGGGYARPGLDDPWTRAIVAQIRSVAASSNLGPIIHLHGLVRGSSPDLASILAAFATPSSLGDVVAPKERALLERVRTGTDGNDFHAELDATFAELEEVVGGRATNGPTPPVRRRGVR